MHPFQSISYDKISNYILNLFNNLNVSVKIIHGYIDELLMVDNFNKNTDFFKFVLQFRQGSFYSFKCEGYFEYLVITKYYTPPVLCYTLKEIKLLLQHFKDANSYLNDIKDNNFAIKNEDFKKLLLDMQNLSIILNGLSEVINFYDLPS